MSEPKPTPENQSAPENKPSQNGNQQQPAFDYEKLANIIAGKQTVTEDTVNLIFLPAIGIKLLECIKIYDIINTLNFIMNATLRLCLLYLIYIARSVCRKRQERWLIIA